MYKGRHYRFRKIEFWAERGMVNVVDERFPQDHPDFFKLVMVGKFLERLLHFSRELKRRTFKYPDEREEYIKLIEEGVACAREAKNQGRPDDPKAVEDMIKERRRNYVLGNGQSADLTTASSETVPEGLLLPPMPRANVGEFGLTLPEE